MIDQLARGLADLSTRAEFTAADDLVFPNSVGNFFDDSRLRRRYARALERAGLKRLRFHELRHTFGTLAVQVFPLSDVMAYMGHADIQTTMLYVHTCPSTTPPSSSHVLSEQGATSARARSAVDPAVGPARASWAPSARPEDPWLEDQRRFATASLSEAQDA
jgi:hypothetical protein